MKSLVTIAFISVLAFSLLGDKFQRVPNHNCPPTKVPTPRPTKTFPPDCPPGWPVQPTIVPK